MKVEAGRHLVLRTDGASRGNPGPAAAGVIIEAPDGTLIAQGGHYLGEMTNNQAEYRALIYGLKAVAHYQPSAVEVFLDSELLVNQLNRRYQVRDAGLRPLFAEARSLADALPRVSFSHVPRAQNHLADAAANRALDAALGHPQR